MSSVEYPRRICQNHVLRGHTVSVRVSSIIICFPYIVDVFGQGIWPKLGEIHDPELKALAGSLPEVVLRGKAPSTATKYNGAFARWKKWAESKHEVSVLPAEPCICASI